MKIFYFSQDNYTTPEAKELAKQGIEWYPSGTTFELFTAIVILQLSEFFL